MTTKGGKISGKSASGERRSGETSPDAHDGTGSKSEEEVKEKKGTMRGERGRKGRLYEENKVRCQLSVGGPRRRSGKNKRRPGNALRLKGGKQKS